MTQAVRMSDFAACAKGKTKITPYAILPETNSPGVSLQTIFSYQSYFDTTLLETALQIQSLNEPIVGSTLRQEQIGGYNLALHPSSQTPIAVQPLVGGQVASAQAVILRPGQILRPHGKPTADSGNFSGFRWGLPFGWLGGGLATLYVFPSSDGRVEWDGSSPEIIFHRQTMQIVAPASMPAAAPFNWPLRFPWPHASRGGTSQAGVPLIGIGAPTRLEMSLQLPDLANPADMRVLIQASNDFDVDSGDQPVLSPVRFVDLTWGSYAANGGAGDLGVNYPIQEVNGGPLNRMAADDGGIQLVDLSGGSLADAYVDVVRYGKL